MSTQDRIWIDINGLDDFIGDLPFFGPGRDDGDVWTVNEFGTTNTIVRGNNALVGFDVEFEVVIEDGFFVTAGDYTDFNFEFV